MWSSSLSEITVTEVYRDFPVIFLCFNIICFFVVFASLHSLITQSLFIIPYSLLSLNFSLSLYLTPLLQPPLFFPLSSSSSSSQDNHYQPPGSDACLLCDCYPVGSFSRTCDRESGQCQCKAGVIGRQCDRCDNPFAEVSASGCEGQDSPQ